MGSINSGMSIGSLNSLGIVGGHNFENLLKSPAILKEKKLNSLTQL